MLFDRYMNILSDPDCFEETQECFNGGKWAKDFVYFQPVAKLPNIIGILGWAGPYILVWLVAMLFNLSLLLCHSVSLFLHLTITARLHGPPTNSCVLQG
jgi:hypothetical protein